MWRAPPSKQSWWFWMAAGLALGGVFAVVVGVTGDYSAAELVFLGLLFALFSAPLCRWSMIRSERKAQGKPLISKDPDDYR